MQEQGTTAWSKLDLYHGLVNKIKEMHANGKFNHYQYQFHEKLWRGIEAKNEMVEEKKRIESRGLTKEITKFTYKFYTVPTPGIQPQATSLVLIYSIPIINGSRGRCTLSVCLEAESRVIYNFDYMPLLRGNVSLEGVVSEYFENGFMEVPVVRYIYDESRKLYLFHTMDRDQFNRKYHSILRYREDMKTLGMGLHPVFGKNSLISRLPPEMLSHIGRFSRPNFDVIEDKERGMG